MKTKKIYISGKISGRPVNEMFSQFRAAEHELTAKGWSVVNPVDIEPTTGLRWITYMVADLKALAECDAIYMMKGWQTSVGASIEHVCAVRENMEIIYEN